MKNISKLIIIIMLVTITSLVVYNELKEEQLLEENNVTQNETLNFNDDTQTFVSIEETLTDKIQIVEYDNFTIIKQLGENYYGVQLSFDSRQSSVYFLKNSETGEDIQLTYSVDLPEMTLGSGSMVVLQDRYLYTWGSYTSQLESSEFYDLKLTRVDGITGEVEVIDEMQSTYPFVYLTKLDENNFISYIVSQDESDYGLDYSTKTVATIYNIDGTKQEIISEQYENAADWTDSKGILIERIIVKDGEIYGFGRQCIAGEYKFFLYNYDVNGTLKDTISLVNFENIIGTEQPVELYIVGNYIVFRTYETLTTYVCLITENGVETITKSDNFTQLLFSINDSYIYFIQQNVDTSTDQVIADKDFPLYVIDTANEIIFEMNFELQSQDAYYIDLLTFSNGDFILQYCDNGEYNPEQINNCIVLGNEIETLLQSEN
ncbi:MAG: hypothetical protein R3Y27_05660 [Clostridia bacterium]